MREYHQPLELVERPVPEPSQPTDVLIRIGGAGVCATDLHAIEGLMEPAGVTLPRVLGHENAGWVEEVGAGVTTVAKGDAVLVFPPHSCGLCVPCRRGIDMLCVHHEFTGLTVDGGFADYVLVPERSLARPAGGRRAGGGRAPRRRRSHRVPRGAAAGASSRCPARPPSSSASAVSATSRCSSMRELGSSSTIAVDTDARRRALAAELGAGEVLDGAGSVDAVRELTGGRGAELVFDFVGTDQSHADSLAMLARGGTYSVIGFGGMVSVPSAVLVVGEQTVTGNLVGTWLDLWEVMQLHARRPARAQDRDASAGSVNDVLAKLREGEVTGRAVLVP